MAMRRSALLGALVLCTAGTALGGAARGATLVVANKSAASVTLIDLATGAPRVTLPTGAGPHEVAISPDGGAAWIADYGGEGAGGSTLTVIDVVAGRVLRTVELAPHRRPHGMAFAGSGRLLVTSESSRALLVVGTADGRLERALPTRAEASHMVEAAPDGRRAYVANIGSGSVTALDLESGALLSEIRTGRGAEGLALSPDGAELWVTNREDDTVSVVDTAALKVVATLPAGDFPIRAKVTPDGKRVLVSCAGGGDLAVFDRASRRLERRIPLPVAGAPRASLLSGRFGASSVPIGIVVAPDGKTAWVAHSSADVISVVSLETLTKTGELRAGREPDGMGISSAEVGAR
jgi:YVTN family beta-propeller protein